MTIPVQYNDKLTPGAIKYVECVLEKEREGHFAEPGLNHWLFVLLEMYENMVGELTLLDALEVRAQYESVRMMLDTGDAGTPLQLHTMVTAAVKRARKRGHTKAYEKDIALAVLDKAGFKIKALSEMNLPSTDEAQSPDPASVKINLIAPTAKDTLHPPKKKLPTPSLEKYCRNLTNEAKAGKLNPLSGRSEELQLIIETLCRRTKRNPALVGPAGVGKTAIVEGLAQYIVQKKVPLLLQKSDLWLLQPSLIVAGAGYSGEMEKRMSEVLAEASQEHIILFIDEVHSLIGAGGMAGRTDMASMMKPPLARGDIACIAATTDDEYRQYIEADAALERRFQPVRIQPLSAEQTFDVLKNHRDELFRLRGVSVDDGILRNLINFADRYLRNRTFPDKAVDLLEQCVASAITSDKKSVEPSDADSVAQRLIGMPLDISAKLRELKNSLVCMGEEESDAMVNRLQVTMRGLDIRPYRPNAIVLLAGEMKNSAESLATAISGALFGSRDRVVRIDLSSFVNSEDLTRLLGASPSYVGYGDQVPIHRLKQTPWCVVLFQNIHACNPRIKDVVVQGLADGFLTDGQGKTIYLSDAVVLLTADIATVHSKVMGYLDAGQAAGPDFRALTGTQLGAGLSSLIDVFFVKAPSGRSEKDVRIETGILAELSGRYQKLGLRVQWDESFISWLSGETRTQGAWERQLDDQLGPALVRWTPPAGGAERTIVVMRLDGRFGVKNISGAGD